MAIHSQKAARAAIEELQSLKANLPPETIRAAALKAGHSPKVAEELAALPGAQAAKLQSITATHREKSAELDRLKAQVASLRAQQTAQAAAPASITAAAFLAGKAKPAMTRSEFEKLPALEKGRAIKQIILIPDPVQP